jgi:hypothetical protein
LVPKRKKVRECLILYLKGLVLIQDLIVSPNILWTVWLTTGLKEYTEKDLCKVDQVSQSNNRSDDSMPSSVFLW